MATATKPQTISTRSANSVFVDGTRIACPLYCGVTQSTAKAIMNSLRAKAGSGSASVVTPGGISVQHSGTSQEEYEITKRLKVDFHTLRSLLFGSDTRGVSLDLALRIQDEIKDDFIFITEEMVRQAFENSLTHYKFYGPQET